MIFLFVSAALAAPCASPSTTTDLAEALTAADTAFVSMDLPGFERARDRAEQHLLCLAEPLFPADAAAFHRLQALASFVGEDAAGAEAAFRASTAVQPGFVLPQRLAPDGHPLREAYEAARALPASELSPLVQPDGRVLYVDGSRADQRPSERPYVLQALEGSGAVAHTAWLPPTAPVPDWATAPTPSAPIPAPVPRARTARTPRTPLLVVSGVAVAGAGGLYGLAWASRASWADEATPLENLDGLRARTNTATVAAGALAGAGIGLGGVALVVAW